MGGSVGRRRPASRRGWRARVGVPGKVARQPGPPPHGPAWPIGPEQHTRQSTPGTGATNHAARGAAGRPAGAPAAIPRAGAPDVAGAPWSLSLHGSRLAAQQVPDEPVAGQRRRPPRACPGSSKRWVAPGTTASSRSQREPRLRPRLSSSTTSSCAADDQQGRAPSRRASRGRGEVGPAAAGHDGGDVGAPGSAPRPTGRRRRRCWRRSSRAAGRRRPGWPRSQSRRRRRAGRRAARCRRRWRRSRSSLGRQQVEQQRAEAGLVEDGGDVAVARAVPAAAAAVGEHDDAGGALGHVRCPPSGRCADRDLDLVVDRDGRAGRRVRACAAGAARVEQRDHLVVAWSGRSRVELADGAERLGRLERDELVGVRPSARDRVGRRPPARRARPARRRAPGPPGRRRGPSSRWRCRRRRSARSGRARSRRGAGRRGSGVHAARRARPARGPRPRRAPRR